MKSAIALHSRLAAASSLMLRKRLVQIFGGTVTERRDPSTGRHTVSIAHQGRSAVCSSVSAEQALRSALEEVGQ